MDTAVFDAVYNCYRSDEQFRTYAVGLGHNDGQLEKLGQGIRSSGDKLCYYDNRELLEALKKLYRYFAPWAVVKGDKSGREIGRVILKAKNEPYIKTIFWS